MKTLISFTVMPKTPLILNNVYIIVVLIVFFNHCLKPFCNYKPIIYPNNMIGAYLKTFKLYTHFYIVHLLIYDVNLMVSQ